MSPQQAFDDFFRSRNRTAEERQSYCGIDQLWGVPDQQRVVLKTLRKHINQLWANESGRLLRLGAHPKLHMDYIDTRRCGAGDLRDRRISAALAFEHEGTSFVGVTRDLLDNVAEFSSRAAESQRIRDGFHLRPDQKLLAKELVVSLFTAQAVFVTAHELGHHVHGHILRDYGQKPYNEFDSGDEIPQLQALISQRKEIVADGYATRICLNNFLLSPGPRMQFLRCLKKPFWHPRADRWLARLVCLAAALFLYSRPGTRKALNRLPHPPALVRMHYIIHQLRDWAAENSRPNLVRWATEGRIQKLISAVEGAVGSSHQEVGWHEQTAFMLSETGAAYRECLAEAEEPVRSSYEGTRWRVLRPH